MSDEPFYAPDKKADAEAALSARSGCRAKNERYRDSGAGH